MFSSPLRTDGVLQTAVEAEYWRPIKWSIYWIVLALVSSALCLGLCCELSAFVCAASLSLARARCASSGIECSHCADLHVCWHHWCCQAFTWVSLPPPLPLQPHCTLSCYCLNSGLFGSFLIAFIVLMVMFCAINMAHVNQVSRPVLLVVYGASCLD